MITVGTKAPEFKLITTELKSISNGDFSGKNVVLLFFPLAFTSVCTQEMCTASDDQTQYSDLDAEVIGISVDSPFVLQKFAVENDIKTTMASDFNRTTCKAYDTLFEDDFMGLTAFAKRSAFVIDKEGVIRYSEITDGKSLPNFEEIKAVLKDC